jgi:hypothetical protein
MNRMPASWQEFRAPLFRVLCEWAGKLNPQAARLPGWEVAALAACLGCFSAALAQQPTPSPSPQNQEVPDAPATAVRTQLIATPPAPCILERSSVGIAWNAAQTAAQTAWKTAPSGAAIAVAWGTIGAPVPKPVIQTDVQLVPCSASGLFLTGLTALEKLPIVKKYARFLDGPQANRLTPRQKAWLAVRDVADPFNGVTILGSSAIAVASNSHSAYGPGFPGFGRYVGVSYTQDITAEFFGTYLIPSVMHQDPRYHRLPNATLKRRIAHAAYQVLWTQGDDGQGMINYADIVGFGIDDQIGNLYIPGRETRASATAQRYLSALALAPVDNYITEFLPDLAKKIHVRAVFVQQIINHIANKDAANSSP